MQTEATELANNFQHCWMLHVASVFTPCCMLLRVVWSCCAKFETGQTFSCATTPTIVGQQCWELLRPFARSLRETNTWYVVCLLKNAHGRTYNDQRRSLVNTEQLQQTLFTHINLALNNSPDQQRLIVVHQSILRNRSDNNRQR